jgi:hypothetical protein
MKQKAEKISIVETPDSWDDIITFTQGASTPADATVAALMAWNFAVEWHAKQDSCCDELRKLKDDMCDELVSTGVWSNTKERE